MEMMFLWASWTLWLKVAAVAAFVQPDERCPPPPKDTITMLCDASDGCTEKWIFVARGQAHHGS